MGFFKKDKKVLGMTFMVRMIVAFFIIVILGVSGTILMADWGGTDTDTWTNGRVGVGTDSPQHDLEVDGTIKMHMLEFDRGQDSNLYSLTREYAIYQEAGPWQTPYPDLRINYISGIKYIANYIYGGHKFYTAQHSDGTPVHLSLSIGDMTDHNVRIYNDLIVSKKVGIGTEPDPSIDLDILDNDSSAWIRLKTNTQLQTGISFSKENDKRWLLYSPSNTDIFRFYHFTESGTGKTIMDFYPDGNIDVKGTTTSSTYACSSDARYKKNVNPYKNALEKVLGLRGVSYFWKTEKYKERNFSKDKQIGFIAQEVEKIIPEVVFTDDKGYKTMSYDRLTTVIIEAIKELKTKNDRKLSALEKENAELKQRLAKLDGLADRLARLEKAVEKDSGKQQRLAGR